MMLMQCLWCLSLFQGTYLTTQAFSQYMIEKQVKSGAIVNISSIVAKVQNVHFTYLLVREAYMFQKN